MRGSVYSQHTFIPVTYLWNGWYIRIYLNLHFWVACNLFFKYNSLSCISCKHADRTLLVIFETVWREKSTIWLHNKSFLQVRYVLKNNKIYLFTSHQVYLKKFKTNKFNNFLPVQYFEFMVLTLMDIKCYPKNIKTFWTL